MKELIKDYGPAIAPFLAFVLGILAIYLKTLIDRRLDRWKTRKRLANLIVIIRQSVPPKYFDNLYNDRSFDMVNCMNHFAFDERFVAITMFIEKIENEVLLNGDKWR